MLTTVWSVKGGSGCTVIAASLAVMRVRSEGRCLLVDLGGDLPAALGMAEPGGPGLIDWLASEERSSDSLDRLHVEVRPGLDLLPIGGPSTWPSDGAADLAEALVRSGVPVIVDAGHLDGGTVSRAEPGVLQSIGRELRHAGSSVLVVRPCYLSLRRAVGVGVTADAVVLVSEPGRSLDRRDVADVLGLPVVSVVDVDPVVSRAIDAGVFVRRLPRTIERQLKGAA